MVTEFWAHRFIQQSQNQLVREWLEALKHDTLVHAAIPPPSVKPLVFESFAYLLSLLDRDAAPEHRFAGFEYIRDHRLNGVDTLLGLLALVLKGKKVFTHYAARQIEDRERFVEIYQALAEAFNRFVIDVTSYYAVELLFPPPGAEQDEAKTASQIPTRLNLFYNAFQHSSDGIVITDINGRIIEVNRAFLEIFGYTYDEVIGQTTGILRSSRTTDAFYQRMWESIRESGSWKGEIINRTKDGREIPVLLSITPIYENGKIVGYMGIEIDRRAQKEMEKRLLQSERFALIGKMASKVAHEIRNPLSAISLNTELLEEEIDALVAQVPDDVKSLLRSIMGEVGRLANLTEEYLQFSRLPKSSPKQANLVEVVKTALEFFEPEANSVGVQIVTAFEPDVPELKIDLDQMRRAVLNILRNAVEAMPRGGIIWIAIKHTKDTVRLEISDSGPGIPPALVNRIFEPFYTTKEMGTGLGLALCQQIVHEHGGTIRAQNRESGGALFTIQLPIS